MNRDGLNRLKKLVQTYDYNIRQADFFFQRNIEMMRDDETDKLERIPESLQSTRKAADIADAETMLNSLLVNAENIINELDEILTSSDVSSVFSYPKEEKAISNEDKKDVRFQALLSSSLVAKLKQEASLRGLSMNEIVNRALIKELSC